MKMDDNLFNIAYGENSLIEKKYVTEHAGNKKTCFVVSNHQVNCGMLIIFVSFKHHKLPISIKLH